MLIKQRQVDNILLSQGGTGPGKGLDPYFLTKTTGYILSQSQGKT